VRSLFPIGIKRYQAGEPDPFGNPRAGYAPVADLLVYGHAPIGTMEQLADRDDATTTLFVFAPTGTTVASNDVIVVNDLDYEMVGAVEEFSHGPYGAPGGVRFMIRRTEG
jgi:hypothetical protein